MLRFIGTTCQRVDKSVNWFVHEMSTSYLHKYNTRQTLNTVTISHLQLMKDACHSLKQHSLTKDTLLLENTNNK